MASLGGTLKVAGRLMARRRALTLARFGTVTLLVAAVTAIFTVANAVLLRPLPFPHAPRLARVYFQPPGTTAFSDADSLDALTFVRLRERTQTMDAVVGVAATDQTITGDGEPESVLSARVSDGFFSVLGAETAVGRTFTSEEFRTAARVVVLSHGFWMRRFGGDPAVVGRAVTIDRQTHTIVGVVSARFEPGFAPSEFWTPLDLAKPSPYFSGIQTIGRHRPGGSFAAVRTELNVLLPEMAKEAPEAFKGWTLGAIDLREAQYGSRRPALLMLLAAVAGLTLIAIANLANLTLADILGRQNDFAIRAALGGSRLGIAAPDVLQSVLIAVSGAAAGLLVASWLAPLALSLDPTDLPMRRQLRLDWIVVACAFALSGTVMLAAVAAPVLRLCRPGLGGTLAAGAQRVVGSRSAHRTRLILVAAQTALAIVLLGSGAMVVATFQTMSRIAPGFDPQNLVTARLRLSPIALPTSESRVAYVQQLLTRLRETPGVLGASTTLNWYIPGLAGAQSLAFVEERPTPDGAPYRSQSRRVTPRYFETMRIPLAAGRDFEESDRFGTQSVAIVSRSFARRFWPDGDPLGRRVKRGVTTKEWAFVIGVAEDVRDVSLHEPPRDTLYTPFLQATVSPLPVTLVVRTAADPRGIVGAIKQAVWSVDQNQALANVVTIEDFLRATLGPQRFRALLVAGYAVLGLLLALIGTYGVTARSVAERTREVGIRLALGGTPSRVWWTLAASSSRAVAAGSIAGAAAAVAVRFGLVALMPELRDASWLYTGASGVVLIVAGLVAALWAARGVVTTEPSAALRAF